MRRPFISLAATVAAVTLVLSNGARAQAVMMPANADLRAMQAPADWEGSRAQRQQDADPDAARWSATDAVPQASPQLVVAPATGPGAPGATDFRVDVWDRDDHLIETMAHCSTLSIGKAAFKEATRERPGQKVTLRRDTFVVATREASAK